MIEALKAQMLKLWNSVELDIGPAPTLVINSRLRTSAGRCFYETGVIDFNPKIDQEFLLTDTLPHELGHLIAYRLYKDHGHSDDWRRCCAMVGLKGAARCHDQPVVRSAQRRWEYTCSCTTHEVATVTHNRIQKGKSYFCKNCKSILEYKK